MSQNVTQQLLKELLEYTPDTGKLVWRPRERSLFKTEKSYKQFHNLFAGKPAFTANSGKGYLTGTLLGKTFKAHRVIWCIVYGNFPIPPLQIDHINGDRADNRLENLRLVDNQTNCKNQKLRRNNSTGMTGVSWNSRDKCWQVAVGNVSLGTFKSFEDACKKRKQAEKTFEYHKNHGRN